MKKIVLIAFILSGIFSVHAHAEMNVVDNNTKITFVVVNGGVDSPNAGTSCIQVSTAIPAICAGFIAIPNNNKELFSAALHAKATGANIWLNYNTDSSPLQHCPGVAMTPCTVSSIGLR